MSGEYDDSDYGRERRRQELSADLAAVRPREIGSLEYEAAMKKCKNLVKEAKKMMECDFEEMPTQDSAENRWACSNCGFDVYSVPGDHPFGWHYCPGCGLKIATWGQRG